MLPKMKPPFAKGNNSGVLGTFGRGRAERVGFEGFDD
jgi:hypothetical protein